MEPSQELDDADLILRHVSRQFPDALARALTPGLQPLVVGAWVDTQVSGRQRRLDRALALAVGDQRRFLHVEWQLTMAADVPFRVYEYNVLFSLALADRAAPGETAPPIDSTVVLLSGRDEPWPAHGEYRTSVPEAPFSGVRFRIEPVYQRTLDELLARESPLWLVFAPLTVDADRTGLANVIAALRARTSPRQFDELAAAMVVLADVDRRRRGLRDVVLSLLPKELVMQNWIYKQGEQKGLEKGLEQGLEKGLEQGLEKGLEQGTEKGLAPLAHLFERRLGRSLSQQERSVLVRRLDTLGPARLGDLVLDLSADSLAAWLAAQDES